MSTLSGMKVFVPCDPVEMQVATWYIAAGRRPPCSRVIRACDPTLHSLAPTDVRTPAILLNGTEVVLPASGAVAEIDPPPPSSGA
jgi:transketolase C-terminal domain/subunit